MPGTIYGILSAITLVVFEGLINFSLLIVFLVWVPLIGILGIFVDKMAPRIGFSSDNISPYALALACIYIPLYVFITLSNKLHPSDNAIGGAGLIIGLCGAVIDFSQIFSA